MITLFVRHQAADCAAWRRADDAFQPNARTLGVQADTAYRAMDDSNEITVTHDFATLAAAEAFAGSPELRSAMHDAGVVGAPTICFAQAPEPRSFQATRPPTGGSAGWHQGPVLEIRPPADGDPLGKVFNGEPKCSRP